MDAALRDLTEAIRLDPVGTDALYNRGVIHERLGQLTEAIDDLTTVIRLNPNEASAYKARADVQRKNGRVDEAIKDFRRASALDPSDVETAAALHALLGRTPSGATGAPTGR